MDIYITGNQALAIVRSSRLGRGVELRACEEAMMPPETCSAQIAKATLRLLRRASWGNSAASGVDLLVSRRAHRSTDPAYSFVLKQGLIRPDEYREVICSPIELHSAGLPSDARLFVDSPVRVVRYAAKQLTRKTCCGDHARQESFARLYGLLSEFMGTYGREPHRPLKNAPRYGLEPVLTTGGVSDYLAAGGNALGDRLARRVLSHAVEGLASPLETAVFALLALPPHYGGIGLSKFDPNVTLHIEGVSTAISHSRMTPDLTSRELGLVIECDGRQYHESENAFVEDRSRWRDYQSLGFAVVPITLSDIVTLQAIDRLVESLLVTAGNRVNGVKKHHVRKALRDKKARDRRLVLLDVLLPS